MECDKTFLSKKHHQIYSGSEHDFYLYSTRKNVHLLPARLKTFFEKHNPILVKFRVNYNVAWDIPFTMDVSQSAASSIDINER